jgi:hypothetical protein
VSTGRLVVRRENDKHLTERPIMNPSYGYQLYQTQRITTRAETLAADALRGHQAATAARRTRGLARTARALVSRAYRRRSPSWA